MKLDIKTKIILVLIVPFLAIWWLLLPGVAGHVTTGDAAELALAGSTLGVPHSPGYPVFAVVNRLMGGLFHFGNEGYRQNLVSLWWLSGAFLLVGLLLIRLTQNLWSGCIPFVAFFTPLFRSQSFVTEVFPLTIFWAALLVFCLSTCMRKRQCLILLGFLFGIGLSIHQTLVLFYPGILYFYFKQKEHWDDHTFEEYLLAAGFFVIGWSVNLYIPVRSMANPILDWEDPETWSRFWGVIFRERYGVFQLAQGDAGRSYSFSSVWAAISFMKNIFIKNFGWLAAGLVLLGSLRSLDSKLYRRLMVSCWLVILLSGPFFFWMARVDLHPVGSGIMDRFALLPLFGCLMVLMLALHLLWSSKEKIYRIVVIVVLCGFILETQLRHPPFVGAREISSFQSILAKPVSSFRWDLSLRDMGLNIFRHVPLGTLLFSDRADEVEFISAYLQGTDQHRMDVQFIDANAGVSKSIYGSDYYRIWGEPRLKRREVVEGRIIQASEGPVFYATRDPAMINIYRTPMGFLYRAWRLDQISDLRTYQWPAILVSRFMPVEVRGRAVELSLWSQLGRYQFDRNLYDEARDSFQISRRYGGIHPDIQMGYLYQKRNKKRQARKSYRQALADGAKEASLFTNLGTLEVNYGNYSGALEVYRQGLKHFPNSIELVYNTSVAYWRLRQWDDVVRVLNRVLELDPNHDQALRLYPKAKSLQRFARRGGIVKPKPSPTPEKKEDPEATSQTLPAPSVPPVLPEVAKPETAPPTVVEEKPPESTEKEEGPPPEKETDDNPE